MMMVDILSGSLLGVPHGIHVSSMYQDLTKGRDLGQLHIVINPAYFTDLDAFKLQITTMLNELKHSQRQRAMEKFIIQVNAVY